MCNSVRWDDFDTIAQSHVNMRDDVIYPEDNIGLDEGVSIIDNVNSLCTECCVRRTFALCVYSKGSALAVLFWADVRVPQSSVFNT
jgi:hypothetical protein